MITVALELSPESEIVNPPTWSFFFKVVLALLGLMNFRISLSVAAKKSFWDFDRDCVGSTDQFRESHHLDVKSSNP